MIFAAGSAPALYFRESATHYAGGAACLMRLRPGWLMMGADFATDILFEHSRAASSSADFDIAIY